MILIPCSLTQTIYFPLNDHFIVLIAPSPECNTVSVPLLAPRPIVPSHPEAAEETLPVVCEVELVPGRPPTVNIKLPDKPPEIYERSLL